MRTFTLPGVDVDASVICLGAGPFGSAYDRDASFAIMDAFAERGGNFFDTAHCYADWVEGGRGVSERTLGAWVSARGVRDRVVIATKGAHPELATMHVPRMRPEHIAQDLAESLDRLGVNYVDLYWLHRDDPNTPVDEIVDALAEHVASGRIRAIGASNWLPARLAAADAYARQSGAPRFVGSQISWSLARHPVPYDPVSGMAAMDDISLAYYLSRGPRVIPYSPQAGGFFARSYADAAKRMPHLASATNRARHAQVKKMAGQMGESPNSVALAYILNHPVGGAAVAGPHSPAQVADTCRAADIALTAEQIRWLEAAG